MVHSLNKIVILLVIIVLAVLCCRCGSCSSPSYDKRVTKAMKTSKSLMGFSDSTLNHLPVLPNDIWCNENTIRYSDGLLVSQNEAEELLCMGRGIGIPREIPVQASDIKKRFASRKRIYLVGKWLLSDRFDTYLLKLEDTKDKSYDIYLVVVNDYTILDARQIAYSYLGYEDEVVFDGMISGPLFAEVNHNKHVELFRFSGNNRINEVAYSIAADGRILPK